MDPRERFKYFACGIVSILFGMPFTYIEVPQFQCINDSAKIPEIKFIKDISSTRSLFSESQAKDNWSVPSGELALARQLYGNTTISGGSRPPQAGSDLDDMYVNLSYEVLSSSILLDAVSGTVSHTTNVVWHLTSTVLVA